MGMDHPLRTKALRTKPQVDKEGTAMQSHQNGDSVHLHSVAVIGAWLTNQGL